MQKFQRSPLSPRARISASVPGFAALTLGLMLFLVTGCSTAKKVGTLTSIAVTPATASIAVGGMQQFTATGTFSDGSTQNLTSSTVWASSSTATATISASGLATGVAVGTTTITATSGPVAGSATLTVTTAATLSSIAVTPANPSIAVGATQAFVATGTFSDGSTQVLTTETWTSGTPATATIDATGLATALAAGTTTITATCGAITGSTLLTVTAAPTLTSIAVTPANPSIAVGATQAFVATGTFSDGSTKVLTTETWTSSLTTVATIDTTGLATGVAAGTTTITATCGTITGTTTLTVTGGTVTLTSIAVTPASPSIVAGSTQQFTATGTFSDGSMSVLTTETWSSSNTAVATIDTTGLATAVGVGTTTITATCGAVSGTTVLTVNATGSSSGSTGILVVPFGGINVDAAYLPQPTVANANGLLTVQAINLDTGTQTSALIASIPMPSGYFPTATAANQATLQVVVVSSFSADVQVIDANTNTLTNTYTSPVTQSITFSGGACMICSALINPAATSNQVLLDTAQGYYTMDLATGTFTLVPGIATASENFAFNAMTQTLLNPSYAIDPVTLQFLYSYTQVITTLGTAPVVSTNSTLGITEPDSSVLDVNTNVGLVVDEFPGTQTLLNLSQLTLNTDGTWTAPSSQFFLPALPVCNTTEMDYVAEDSGSHIMFSGEEFGGSCAAVEDLPSTTPPGAPPLPTTYNFGVMPNTPDTFIFQNGADPHGVAVFTSVMDGKSYGFLVDFGPNFGPSATINWIAKVDLAGALAAAPAPGANIDFTPFVTYLPTQQ